MASRSHSVPQSRFLQFSAALLPLSACLLSSPAPAGVRQENRVLKGLTAPAEIRVDHWGVAHISARNRSDAFFLQGYNAARDRLWQIDLWRKRGLGLLAESFGPEFAEQDRASRLFLYRGSMRREWAAYPRGARHAASDFVRGVNAYVNEVLSGHQPLPFEFAVTGTKPSTWEVEDVVRIRSHALSRNLPSEVARSRIACIAGLEADVFRQHLSPKHRTRVPAGLDPCAVPDDVLALYRLATGTVTFSSAALRPVTQYHSPELVDSEGSNAWAIAAAKSATGRPILASDPHRAHGLPSLRYVVHLSTPDWSVIGAGEPALPGVSFGHNGTAAFGLTFASADQEDLYIYDLHPNRPELYRYRGGWERMRRVRETVRVRGQPPREIELLFTRHGPVLHLDASSRRAFALRTVWSEPGSSPYFASVGLIDAKDRSDLKNTFARWGSPASNQIHALSNGQIGGFVAGRIPLRRNWDGLMPVPGDGRYEWSGFVPFDRLPRPFSAEAGWIASANEMNISARGERDTGPIGYEWPNSARYDRITGQLAGPGSVSVADSAELQGDIVNGLAARLVGLLIPLAGREQALDPAIGLLARWDHRMATDSAAAALFETWTLRHLGRVLVERAAPEAARPLIGSGSLDSILELILLPDERLGDQPVATRDAILLVSLEAAVADLKKRLGADMSSWAWGRLHHAEPQHDLQGLPLSDSINPAVDRQPLPGGYLTVRASGWRPQDFRSVVGASLRMVIDVGAWDNSLFINAPGQSGDPDSPHFRDHYSLWANGEYVPLLYSPDVIRRETKLWLRLRPAVGGALE